MNRTLRLVKTGDWCAASMEDEAFPDDGGDWADAHCLTLGLRPGSLEVVDWKDGEPDPRGPESAWLKEAAPPPPPPPQPTLAERLAPDLAIVAKDPALAIATVDALGRLVATLAGG